MGDQSAIRNPQSAIVFVHGAGSNADFWHWQRAVFPSGYYVNLPGHRRGRGGEGGEREIVERRSIEGYADWLEGYVAEAGLSDVVLNGHSMGGGIALTLALRKPEWLRGIILTGTGARLRVSPRILELLRTDYPAAVDAIIEASFAPANGTLTYAQKVRMNGTRRQMLRIPPEITLADYEACNEFDVMGRVGEIDLPVLCIVGAQDAMTPVKYSEYLHKAIHGSRLEVIEGAGHMLPIEKPEEYNGKIGDFVGKLSKPFLAVKVPGNIKENTESGHNESLG